MSIVCQLAFIFEVRSMRWADDFLMKLLYPGLSFIVCYCGVACDDKRAKVQSHFVSLLFFSGIQAIDRTHTWFSFSIMRSTRASIIANPCYLTHTT